MEIKSYTDFQVFHEEHFVKRVVFKKEDSAVFILNFQPGQALPVHNHPGSQVYLMVLEGTGMLDMEGKEEEIKQDDLIHVDGDTPFSIRNHSEHPLSIHVVLSKIPGEQYTRDI